MSSHPHPHHSHEHHHELGETHDEHDFMGHDFLTAEGTAHLAAFFQRLSPRCPLRMLMGIFVPENPESAMSLVGVDITNIAPKNCCLGPDSRVFLMKITEARTKKVVKVQVLSPGSDVLRLTGKYLDFSADETFIGQSAVEFIKAITPDMLDLVDLDYLDDTFAWSGTLRLAGFKFSEIQGDLLDLT